MPRPVAANSRDQGPGWPEPLGRWWIQKGSFMNAVCLTIGNMCPVPPLPPFTEETDAEA